MKVPGMRIPIAPYGVKELTVAGALCVVGIAAGIALPLYPLIALAALALGFSVYFFRDPDRWPPEGDGLLLSPADGTVTDISPMREPEFIAGPAVRVGVFMDVTSVHVNRAPCAGRVAFVRHVPGRFLNALHTDEASMQNEANLIGIVRADGTKVLVRQIAGLIARRIVCSVHPGDELAAGQRIGMIKFGSRLETWLPADAPLDVRVQPGDSARAGCTVLGEMR